MAMRKIIIPIVVMLLILAACNLSTNKKEMKQNMDDTFNPYSNTEKL